MSAKRTCGYTMRRGSVVARSNDGAWRTCCITRDDRGYRAPSQPVPSALWCIHRQQAYYCRLCGRPWANELPIAMRHLLKLRPPRR
jgi:hypothetical protein